MILLRLLIGIVVYAYVATFCVIVLALITAAIVRVWVEVKS